MSKIKLEIDNEDVTIVEGNYIYRSFAYDIPAFTFNEVETGNISYLVSQFLEMEQEIIIEFNSHRNILKKGIEKYNKLIAFI